MITVLSQFPTDLLDQILKDVEINGLLWLIHSLKYTEAERCLRMSIASRISKLNLVYTNRINKYTYLGMYLLTESYIRKTNMSFIGEPKDVLALKQFASAHKNVLTNVVTVSYYIWDLSDFNEFLELVKAIGPDTGFKLNLEIEIDPGSSAIIDFNVIVQRLASSRMNDIVIGFYVTNYTNAKECEFSAGLYPNLQNIWIINSHFTNRHEISSDNKIINLKISPHAYGGINNKAVTVAKNLPSNLRTLSLCHTIVVPSSLQYRYPDHIEHLQLTSIRDQTNGQFIYELVANNIDTLLSLHIENLYTTNEYYMGLLSELLSKRMNVFKGFKLFKSFDIGESFHHSSLRHLEVSQSIDITNASFPMSLTKLNVSNCNLDTFKCPFPPNLIELFLSHNPIDWSKVETIVFPKHLRRLELKNTGVGDIFKLVLPDCLRTLALEVNSIKTIDNYKFPRQLTSLGLGSNRIKSIKKHRFPPTLTIVHLTENYINSSINFAKNIEGEKLNLCAIYLNNNDISHISNFRFCGGLQVINFDDNRIKELNDITFPKGLNELSFYGCKISSIKNVDFNGCKILNFGNNHLKSLTHTAFPETLEDINLSYNKLTTVDSMLFASCNLTRLNLSHNYIKPNLSLHITPGFKHLNVSDNEIQFLKLFYDSDAVPAEGTELSSVNIARNKLFKLSPSDLGDKHPIRHEKLFELDLSGTKHSKAQGQADFERFPNLQALFLDWSGTEDDLGYPIFDNVFQNSFYRGKRSE